MENMILLSSQVNSQVPRNIPQAHWKQDTSMGAKSSSVPLGLHYIITTSQSLEFINVMISKNYKYLMSCLPQLRFIFKKGHLVWLGKQSHHTSLSLSKPQHPYPPLPWFLKEAVWQTKKSFREWMKLRADFGAPVDCSTYVILWTGPLLVMTSSSVGLSLMT